MSPGALVSSGQILHAAGVRIALQSASNCEERRIEWPYAKDDGSQKDALTHAKFIRAGSPILFSLAGKIAFGGWTSEIWTKPLSRYS